MLREALALIGRDAVLTSIGVSSDEAACVTVIQATLLPHTPSWAARESDGLREQAARVGASVDIDPVPGGVRFAWHLPLITAGAAGP